jgi:hypothetical protein
MEISPRLLLTDLAETTLLEVMECDLELGSMQVILATGTINLLFLGGDFLLRYANLLLSNLFLIKEVIGV